MLSDLPARARRIGYVPQETALFPHLSVERNIRYGGRHNDLLTMHAIVIRKALSPFLKF